MELTYRFKKRNENLESHLSTRGIEMSKGKNVVELGALLEKQRFSIKHTVNDAIEGFQLNAGFFCTWYIPSLEFH